MAAMTTPAEIAICVYRSVYIDVLDEVVFLAGRTWELLNQRRCASSIDLMFSHTPMI